MGLWQWNHKKRGALPLLLPIGLYITIFTIFTNKCTLYVIAGNGVEIY